jgi:hypothetical protein
MGSLTISGLAAAAHRRGVGVRRPVTAIALALGAPVLAAAPTAAQGPPVVNTTEHIVNETSTFIDVHPCTGQEAEITVVENGVIHFAAFADGTVHFTGTLRGTFSADLLPADGAPDITGRYTTWFGGNGLLNEDGTASGKAQTAFTFNLRGTNADGTPIRTHQNGNTVFDPNGVPKVDVFHERANCH